MSDHRLPASFVPEHYDVELAASPRRPRFRGRVTLTGRSIQPTRSVELHARGLTLGKLVVRRGPETLPARLLRHPDRETVEVVFASDLKPGKLELGIDFAGPLDPSLRGLYLARDGADRAVVSQCEASEARAIFPCLDEPAFKATFRFTVRTDPGLVVIGNAPVAEVRTEGKEAVHVFRRTAHMSTYLVALTIGDYEATRRERVSGIPCRVVCGPGRLHQTGMARAVTAAVIPWYEAYFGHRYPYAKLDQVAVPGFDAGAMENVGAIFYRQSLLLLQPGATSLQAEKRSAEVIAHEIAHQWFGNLVTMRWWDDLWLNEAFATWIAFKAVDAWRPEWRLWHDFHDNREAALVADALASTHPIYTEVRSPAEATEQFDIITYEKGGAVLRMVEGYLGAPVFQQGIQGYIAEFQGGNATGEDLWGHLGAASAEPVTDLMRSWILQPGFPRLSVSLSRRKGRNLLRLRQERLLADPAARRRATSDPQRWNVPVVVAYDAGDGPRTHRVRLDGAELTFELPGTGPVRWVYPNADATGCYRLDLDPPLLRALLRHGLGHLPAPARATVLQDLWALVHAGLAELPPLLDALVAVRGDHEPLVVRAVIARLGYLDQHLVDRQHRAALRDLCGWLLRPCLDALGWDPRPGEPLDHAPLRAAVVEALGAIALDPEVLAEAGRRARAEREAPDAVDPNLAAVVVRLEAQQGDLTRFHAFVEEFARRKARRAAPEIQSRYLGALAVFETPAAVRALLDLCLGDVIPQEQLRAVLGSMLGRAAAQEAAWTFLQARWDDLAPRVGGMGLARLVESTGALPPARRKAIEAFFAAHPVEGARRAVQKVLEAMRLREGLIRRERRNLSAWLERWSAG